MNALQAARVKGAADARAAFSALHATDKPPPTWAHGGAAKITIPSVTQMPLRGGEAPCPAK